MNVSESTVSIDWLTVGGGAAARSAFVEWASGLWGAPEEVPGRHYFRRALKWASGARLQFEPFGNESSEYGADHSVVEFSGSAMGEIPTNEQPDLIATLWRLGFCSFTRLDVALDFKGEGVRLVKSVYDSCEAGQLARLRSWDFHGSARGIETVNCGGRESGRMLRVYDKGIERGGKVAGQWVRWEREFRREPVKLLSSCLVAAATGLPPEQWMIDVKTEDGRDVRTLGFWEICRAFAVMGIDFVDRRQGGALERATRCGWFAEFIEHVHRVIQPRLGRVLASFESFRAAVRRQYAPTFYAMLKAAGGDICALLDTLGIVAGCKDRSRSPVVRQFALSLSG